MNYKKYGLFTPSSINLYTETNIDNPDNFLKRNAILFENLVIIPMGIGKLDGSMFFTKESYLNAFSREKIKNKKDFSDILISIEEFVEDEKIQEHIYTPRNTNNSMWQGENSSLYVKFVMEYVQKKNGYNKPDIQSREHKKELEYYVGTISGDFQTLTETSLMFPELTGLYSELHEQAFKATYSTEINATKEKKIISNIESINHFDFGALSWNEIIELRNSHFAKDFRKKIFEWTNEFNNGVNSSEVERKIEKFIDDAKFDFIDKRKPNLLKSTITGILGNIPSSFLFNPVSVISSIEQIFKDKKTNDEFGWLMFIQKARKNCN